MVSSNLNRDGTKKTAIGIDLGGTKVSVGLLNSKGQIVAMTKDSVLDCKNHKSAKQGQNQLIQMIANRIDALCNIQGLKSGTGEIAGVGLASAGPLNVETGELIHPANFPKWKSLKIVQLLKRELKNRNLNLPIHFQNDAVSAAFAEGWIGGAKGLTNYAVITVGTGIGTGLIHQGRPVQFAGMGSEFGHLIVDVNKCSRTKRSNFYAATVEGIASGTGIMLRARSLGSKANRLEDLEKKFETAYEDVAPALAALCFNLSIGFNIQKFLFSGGLMEKKSLFFPEVKRQYKNLIHQWNPKFSAPIETAKAGVHAGLVGAAAMVYQN